MTLVMGAFTIGLILSLLTIGVWIAFRVLRFTDITVDGSLTLGAAVAAVLLVRGTPPWAATLAKAVALHTNWASKVPGAPARLVGGVPA